MQTTDCYSSYPATSSSCNDPPFGIPYGNPCEEVSPSQPAFDIESAPAVIYHPPSQDSHHINAPGNQVGCLILPLLQPVLLKDHKKLSIPFYDPTKLPWHTFSMKLHATLIDCNMDYLLSEQSTTAHNGKHSKELMIELYKKLQGSALAMFSSLHAQQFYLGGGCGVGMVRTLADKFNPLDAGAVQSIMSTMHSLTLLDTEDLSTYKD